LSEIDTTLLESVSTDSETKSFDPLAAIKTPPVKNTVDPAFIAELFKVRGFSATSLNNYLRSPWEYYFKNLLRIPQTQPTHLLFGTAVHAVLQRATAAHTKTGTLPTDQQLLTWLEHSLATMPLNTLEYTELHARGLEIILPYLSTLAQRLPAKTEEEFSISVELETGDPAIPSIPLKGNLDRLDFDTKGNLQQVVDYKTGKPKSRNVIEGNTQSSDGSYKRQLVFYALLLELYDDDRYRCNTGVLSFVESAAAGNLKEETFEVTKEEVQALKQEIIAAAQALVNGSWLTQTCEPAECDYCHLLS
jgi:DNA helicase-2/ATP-dependent DNA helicase PcrA